MLAKELGDSCNVRLPVFRSSAEIHKDCSDARRDEKRDYVLKIFVKIGIKDALIHELQSRSDVEQNPAEIVQLQWRENGRAFFTVSSMLFP